MHSITEIRDPHLIKAILAVDNLYDTVVWDGSPSLSDLVPDMYNTAWFAFYKNANIAGLAKLDRINNVMWNCHIIIFKDYRGDNSIEWGKQVIQYMKHQYKAKKLLALTPYKIAAKYAEKIGFRYITNLKKSIVKNGEILNQDLLELEIL